MLSARHSVSMIRMMILACLVIGCQVASERTWRICAPCSISLTRGVTVGQLDGPGELLGDPAVRSDSRGRTYVASHLNGGVIVFDSAGRHARTIGRRGMGPGEFEVIGEILLGDADTVFVFDRRNRNVTVLSPGHDIVRVAKVPAAVFPSQVTRLPNGRFVIAELLPGPDGVLQFFHLLDADFDIDRSFGPAVAGFDRVDPLANHRMITAAGPAELWAGRADQYLLELWSTDGTKVREIRRTADWLPRRQPVPPRRYGEPILPAPPGITNVQFDPRGFIWILGRVIDKNWKPPRAERVGNEERLVEEQPDDDNYDTVIEVLNATTGALVASTRHPMFFNRFSGPRMLVHRDQMEDGRLLLTTFHLQLAGPAGNGPSG